MKKKTDAKRQNILGAAYQLFRANGFEKTSMSEIAALAAAHLRVLLEIETFDKVNVAFGLLTVIELH